MNIVESIRREHRESLANLGSLSHLARHMEKGGPLKVCQVKAAVTSFLDFNNRCHHFKEEKLFQILALKADDDQIPLLMELEAEHKAANELLKGIHRQIHQAVPQISLLKSRIVETLWTFVELNRRHIDKEEKSFVPMVENLIALNEQIRLSEHLDPKISKCHLATPSFPQLFL